MKIRVMEWVVTLVVLVPFAAVSAPEINPANNHYYEVFSDEGIPWGDAETIANRMKIGAVQGHLATITSAEEDEFVDDLRQAAFDGGDIPKQQVWIGGHQMQDPPPDGPGDGWVWVNVEGLIPGTNSTDLYANWAEDEPNNAGSGELGLTLGRNGLYGGWNDEGAALGLIGGFVVEFDFDKTTDAQNCHGEPDIQDPDEEQGCNPSGTQNIQIPPPEAWPEGAEITEALLRPDPDYLAAISLDDGVREACSGEFVYPDPRVDVDGFPDPNLRQPLYVFDVFGHPDTVPSDYDLVLDEYTYGSPCFAVVFGSTANFNLEDVFPNGVAITRLQFPERVPGIGPVNKCYDPDIGSPDPNPNYNPDLQKTSQLTYQTDDRSEMVEKAAAVVTNACFNPSRGSTVRFSFGVLNTAEHCGIDFDGPNGPADILQCFYDLAVAKFDALDQALVSAAPKLVSPKLSSLTKEVNRARSMVKNGHFSRAVTRLKDLLTKVNGAEWDNIDGRNHPGVLVMRIENLLFRVDQLRLAEANLP